MRTEYLCIATAAVMWGTYPLLLRSTGQGSAGGTLLLTLSGLVPILAAVIWQGGMGKPTTGELVRLLAAGIMMGAGLIAFNQLTNSRTLDASISIPIVDTAMLIVTVLGAVWFFAEPFTARKAIGIALLLGGIFVLRPA
jgi:drug/metabolite transporter (DMT)-like permease